MSKFILLLTLFIAFATRAEAQGSGNSLTFNGTTQSIDIGTTVAANCRTIEFWFMPSVTIDPSLSDVASLIIRDYDNGNGLNTNEFGFYISPSSWSNGPGTLHFARRVNTASYDVASNANSWQANVWYHVAGVIDPVQGMKLYINGVLQNSTNPTTEPIQPQTGSATDMVAIGAWGYWGFSTNGRLFNGDIDEIRFWSCARTQNQIRDNMCRKINPSQPGLQAYYRFDNSSGTTLSDLTGNGYNGATNGMSSSAWHYSAAPIGDTAINAYLPSWTGQTLSLPYATGDIFSISNVTASPEGAHIYRVASLPNSITGLNNPLNDYYGVFLTNTSGNYEIAQDFSGLSGFCSSGCMGLAARTHNAITSWTGITPSFSLCTYAKTNESSVGIPYRAEYILNLVNAAPLHSLGPDTFVCGTSYTLAANVPNATYAWSTGATSSSITITESGTYWLDITQNGCTSRDSVKVTFSAPITNVATSVSSPTVCAGQPTTLTAQVTGTGSYSYTWSPGNIFSNPAQVNPQTTTVYTVSVSNGCYTSNATATVVIGGFIPQLTLPPPLSGCPTVCVTFSASPATHGIKSWLWSFGDGTNDTAQIPTHCYSDPGNYNVTLSYTASTGCSKSISTANEVSVFSIPDANFTASTFQTDILNPEILFYDQSADVVGWQWNFGDSYSYQTEADPSHVYLNIGNYTVNLVVSNDHGCKDSTQHEVSIIDAFTFYAPNAFSPNGDDLNDIFTLRGTGWDNSSFTLVIYDRWGRSVFSSKDPTKGWDGRISNDKDPVQQDTFVWKATLKDVLGKSHQYSGLVQIID